VNPLVEKQDWSDEARTMMLLFGVVGSLLGFIFGWVLGWRQGAGQLCQEPADEGAEYRLYLESSHGEPQEAGDPDPPDR
jgi:hypothetical protein